MHVPLLAILVVVIVALTGLAVVMGWRRILAGPAGFPQVDACRQGKPQ
jgi:hypothetical protein